MTDAVSIRRYELHDRPDCLALFESNLPEYFALEERAEYEAFLDAPRCQYLVAYVPEQGIVAAGGYYVAEVPTLGALAWGIVARSWHRRGVGTEILTLRLAKLRALGVQAVPPAQANEVKGSSRGLAFGRYRP